MFKFKSSVLLAAIVVALTLCSFRTQAQNSGKAIVNIDSLVTDSATGADAIKLVNVITNGPKDNSVSATTAWILAVLMAGIALYKHVKTGEHKAAAVNANKNSDFYYNELEKINKGTVMNAEQFASKCAAEKQFAEGTHPAQAQKAKTENTQQYQEHKRKRQGGNTDQPKAPNGKFTKRRDDGNEGV